MKTVRSAAYMTAHMALLQTTPVNPIANPSYITMSILHQVAPAIIAQNVECHPWIREWGFAPKAAIFTHLPLFPFPRFPDRIWPVPAPIAYHCRSYLPGTDHARPRKRRRPLKLPERAQARFPVAESDRDPERKAYDGQGVNHNIPFFQRLSHRWHRQSYQAPNFGSCTNVDS